MKTIRILEIAVPAPLRRQFDYLPPIESLSPPPVIGARVSVEFGYQQLIGIITGIREETIEDTSHLKHVTRILDEESVLPGALMPLMQWAAEYYQHPIGESLSTALPNALRKNTQSEPYTLTAWVKENAFDSKIKARQQQLVLAHIEQYGQLTELDKKHLGINNATLKTLTEKGLIRATTLLPSLGSFSIKSHSVMLNPQQQAVIDHFAAISNTFKPCLLEGITGSGKTEVYLQLIAQVLQAGKQALVLVPEIGLTPQTIERFKARFDCEMAIFHSSLTDMQRLRYWQKAKCGEARIIIGTRSALFTATHNLGLIIVDEEHDLSYKQQDGLRYSARDTACMRAKLENIPIVLGSATPTLETLHNALSGKYIHWQLTERAGNAAIPSIEVIDIRRQASENGLADNLLPEIDACLQRGEQAFLFINRRGFAPSLICHDCGWVSQCNACDAHLTVHQQSRQLRCHHCNASEALPHQCPKCRSRQLVKAGAGTERLEQHLRQHFLATPIFRIDRDTTRYKDALPEMLEGIHNSQAAILIGTQMLAKGHHFPNVTLVIIIDADQSLISTDYRAIERFGQLITQVSGRAGRENKPGRALIQSHYPDHPQLLKLIHWGYHAFAQELLAERKACGLPPFSAQALVRLEDKDPQLAEKSLQQLRESIRHLPCLVIGPYPASLQRRAWHFRYQLLIQCRTRQELRSCTQELLQKADSLLKPHRQRWSIDIDPQDMS